MRVLFVTRESEHIPRNFQALECSHKQIGTFGTETISYRRPQIWSLIPEGLTTLTTLKKF